MDDPDRRAAEVHEEAERKRRQSFVLLLLAGLVLAGALITGLVFLLRTVPPGSSFTGHVTPTPVNGWYRIAEGRSFGDEWSVEFGLPGPCIVVRVDSRDGPIGRSCGFEVTADSPIFARAAAHTAGDERETILFGAAAPRVGEIELVGDGEPIPVVLSDPPAFLQLHVRFFAALVRDPDRLEITVLDRAGEVIFRDEQVGPDDG